jgi:hypothetical protein
MEMKHRFELLEISGKDSCVIGVDLSSPLGVTIGNLPTDFPGPPPVVPLLIVDEAPRALPFQETLDKLVVLIYSKVNKLG